MRKLFRESVKIMDLGTQIRSKIFNASAYILNPPRTIRKS